MANPELCVCVLLYGSDDYCYRMAERVINAPLKELGARNCDFRFGLNAVSDKTRDLVLEAVAVNFSGAVVVDCPENIFKYPMMRRLLAARPLLAPITMWFDDDSCIVPGVDTAVWLARIQQQMQACAMLGSIYRERFIGSQAEWVKAQPWYNGKPTGPYTQFAAGGWWAIRTAVLTQFNWPAAVFRHRGGDIMLGELLRQHDLPLGHFRDNLWINANEYGVEAKSVSRGQKELPIGYNHTELVRHAS
jgi:hypothetical protein